MNASANIQYKDILDPANLAVKALYDKHEKEFNEQFDIDGKKLFDQKNGNGFSFSWKAGLATAVLGLVAAFTLPAFAPLIALGIPTILGAGGLVGAALGYVGGFSFGKTDETLEKSVKKLEEGFAKDIKSPEFLQKAYETFIKTSDTQISILATQKNENPDHVAAKFYRDFSIDAAKAFEGVENGKHIEVTDHFILSKEGAAQLIKKADALQNELKKQNEQPVQELLHETRAGVAGAAKEAEEIAEMAGLPDNIKSRITTLAEKLNLASTRSKSLSTGRNQSA